MKEVTILIYQSLDEFDFYSFEHPVIQWVSGLPNASFSLDAVSGADILNYANLFIEKSERLVLVLLFDKSNNNKNLHGLLRKTSSKKEKLIVSLGRNDLADKMNAENYESVKELKERVEKWISQV